MGRDAYRVPVDQLRVEYTIETFGERFETTAELQPRTYVIQQNRAFQALALGLEQEGPGFHIFVVGPTGTGRRTLTLEYVQQFALRRPPPPDICYTYNFENPDTPLALLLPPGKGRILREEIRQFRRLVQEELPKIFESSEYEEFRRRIEQELHREQAEAMERLQERARALGFMIVQTPTGLQAVPIWQGKPVTPDVLVKLPEDFRRELAKQEHFVEELIQDFLKESRKRQREAVERVQQRERELVQRFLQPVFHELMEIFADQPKVIEWLRSLQRDFMQNLKEVAEAIQQIRQGKVRMGTYLDRFQVNLLVSHAGREGAPVVFESNPTFYNLFGRIERFAVEGIYVTNFMMIKPGSVHRANGGFLLLDALELFKYPLVWDTLKRVLQRRELTIEDYAQHFSPIPLATLRPEPVPIHLKVILIGPQWLYQLLYLSDEDFRKLFKIKVEFQPTFEARNGGLEDTVRYIARVCHAEGLPPLDRSAVQEVLTYSSRIAGDRDELTAQLHTIADLVREAAYWARQQNASVITADIVRHTIDQMRYRQNLIEERIHRLIDRQVLFIDVDGKAVGQVNGLAVYAIGGYTFGKPTRITATVSVGRDGIANIERQVRLSGPIHDKGVFIFTGFLKSTFARTQPLSLSASICFEQSYESVEGDSASLAELIALLSAIGQVPVDQGIAVTGSVNQKGQVQPVGGINEKIEGFFDVCVRRGLTGRQGVIIPYANLRHVNLHPRVIRAVAEGQFHIYAVRTVEEAVEILTDLPAGTWNPERNRWEPEDSVFARVSQRLQELARAEKKFERAEKEKAAPREEEPEESTPAPPAPPEPGEPPESPDG